MPEDLNLPLEDGDGNPTNVTGDDAQPEGGGAAVQPSHPDLAAERQRRAEVERGAQLAHQRNQELMAYIARLEGQMTGYQQAQRQAPPQPQASQGGDDFMSAAEAAALSDAYIDKNTDEIRRLENIKSQRAVSKAAELSEQRVLQNLTGIATQGQKVQASIAAVASDPAMRDPTSALYQATVQRYNEIVNDPSYGYIEETQVPFGPGITVNPHKLATAMREVKGAFNAQRRSAEREGAGDGFVEPSAGAASRGSGKAFNPSKHLSAEERAMVDDLRRRDASYDSKKFWDNLPKDQREERLKQGKPVRFFKGVPIA